MAGSSSDLHTPVIGDKELPARRVARYRWGMRYGAPLGIYLLGVVVVTWPLALHFSDTIILGGSGDGWQHLWHIWWVKYSLLDLHHAPFHTSLLFYSLPSINLYLDSLNVLTGLVSIPLQDVFGLVTTFNLIVIVSLTLAGYMMYLLAAYLCGNYPAAFVAGVIFAFCPVLGFWVTAGQLDLIPVFWLPLYFLLYLKALRGERWRWTMPGAIGCFVALSLTSWYFCYYSLIASGLLVLYTLGQRPKMWRGSLVRGMGILVAGVLVLAPVLVKTITATSDTTRQSLKTIWINSATLSDLFQPGTYPVWSLSPDRPDIGFHGWLFLGFIPLAFAVFGLIRQFTRVWFWVVAALVFLEIALGPSIQFGISDSPVTQQMIDNSIPAPNRLLYALPFGDAGRLPTSSLIMTMLFLAVAAAFGLAQLVCFRRVARYGWVIAGVVAVLVFGEFSPLPRPIATTTLSPFYQTLAAVPGQPVVLDLPDIADSYAMYTQTQHHKPMVGGYTARRFPYPLVLTPGIKELRSTAPVPNARDIIDPTLFTNTPAVLAYENIAYVIFHRRLATISPSNSKSELSYIQSVFSNVPPFYQDADIMVWRVADLPRANACGAGAVLMERTSDWNGRQITATGEPGRTMSGAVRLTLFNPTHAPVTLRLTADVQSVQTPRHLQLIRDQTVVRVDTVGVERQQVQWPLTLQPGANEIELRSVEPGTVVNKEVQAFFFYPFKLSPDGSSGCAP